MVRKIRIPIDLEDQLQELKDLQAQNSTMLLEHTSKLAALEGKGAP